MNPDKKPESVLDILYGVIDSQDKVNTHLMNMYNSLDKRISMLENSDNTEYQEAKLKANHYKNIRMEIENMKKQKENDK